MRSRAEHLLHAPAEPWHADPIESWQYCPRDDEPEGPNRDVTLRRTAFSTSRSATFRRVTPKTEPIGFAHNGFHVDEERFQPLPPPAPEEARPSRHERSARHYLSEKEPEKRPFWFESNGRHSRDDPDDASSYGRHSMPLPATRLSRTAPRG